ncbi:MAG: acetate--CoA ligase family protein, partial [Rhodospirillales bacterium]|nr:acetate--CoA ligase family protein [Rhodospirillales bacterium]
MTIRNLEYLFRPKSVAIVGASNDSGSVGSVVMDNLLLGGFGGPLMPVNPDHLAVKGVYAYRSIAALPQVPELAVIDAPPREIPELVRQLGQRGAKAAVLLSSCQSLDEEAPAVRGAIADEARRANMRVLGPDSLGLIVPQLGLNASIAHCGTKPGRIAFVSQSSALCTTVLDWAQARNIGFSHFICTGDAIDVDFDDVIDYLGSDAGTAAILMCIETITDAGKFISAARAASRNMPLLAVKFGPGSDEVYDAALRRAGILRVRSIEQIFEAAETLSHSKPPSGDRIAVLANSGAVGRLAVDELAAKDGKLAEFSQVTIEKLAAALPGNGGYGNPLDIHLCADGPAYARALAVLLEAPEVDSVLVMHCPSAVTSAEAIAHAVTETIPKGNKKKKPVGTCWMGERAVQTAREYFGSHGVPTYNTPEQAVRAYMHLIHYRRTQEILMETPSSVGIHFQPEVEAARAITRAALEAGHRVLDEQQAMAVLAAYGIPHVPTRLAATTDETPSLATELGFPVALKIWSDDIVTKSDVGGVVLDLAS